MRKLISGMKISLDGMTTGKKGEGQLEGIADWVEAWSDDYGMMDEVDACMVGGGMYPGYERYWTSIQNEPEKPVWITGGAPTEAERKWARFAAETAHYVLSSTLTSALWPKTSFIRDLDSVAALKQQPGKNIYLMGGAHVTASLIDAGLVDELRLIVYPLIAGEGKPLFATTERRRALQLRKVEQLQGGRLSLIYRLG